MRPVPREKTTGHPVSYLKDIAVFVRVVDLKGFAAAGRALGLTAPSVSKQIARLEAELGIALLHRTTHNLFLTDAGNEFYEHCVKGLAELELARATAVSFNEELRGKLRVHTTMAVGQTLIAPILVDFMAANPGIRIDLEMSSLPINPMELQVDVAIRSKTPRETSPGHISIGRRILGRVRHVLVASPAYLAKAGRPKTVSDIRNTDCLLYVTYSTFSESWLFHNGRQETTLKIEQPLLRSNNWLIVRDAALSGLGIARLPEFTVRSDLAEGRLVSMFEDQVRSDLQVLAVFPRTQRMPAKTRLLLDYLAERLSVTEGRKRAEPVVASTVPPEPVRAERKSRQP
jgi:DNA-binding transcriptional LysR family regulator